VIPEADEKAGIYEAHELLPTIVHGVNLSD